MNVLALLGSPRKKGNTATLLRALLEGMAEAGEHTVREVFLHGRSIAPCRNCDRCRGAGAGRLIARGEFCALDDDMRRLYPRFLEADLVVFATPVYWWSISAQLKLFIDRLYALDALAHPEHFAGKKVVLLLTHEDPEPCSGAELTAGMFREIADYTDMHIVGDLRYSSGDRHVQDCPEKLAQARRLGRQLATA